MPIIETPYPSYWKWKREVVDEVETILPYHKYQMVLVAEYINEKTLEVVEIESYSEAWPDIDEIQMYEEAIRQAQGQLGGSNWVFLFTYDVEFNVYYQVPLSAKEKYERKII